MNERIRDLQIQAFAECKTFEDDKVRTDEVFERFAELLVLACAKVSERTGALNEADFEGEMISDAIKEHFGVEE
jgi:hypothetical protein